MRIRDRVFAIKPVEKLFMHDSPHVLCAVGVLQTRNDGAHLWLVFVLCTFTTRWA